MDMIPIPTAEIAAAAQLEAKYKASCNLPLLLERIAERAFDPTTNFKTLLDAGEYMYKVSGMAAKQVEKVEGSRFSITIKLPGSATTHPQEITIGHGSAVETLDLDFPPTPDWIAQLEVVETL